MAAGNPVFALDATGARDMVQHGVSGWLLSADSTPQAFSSVLESVVADSARLESMRLAAIESARSVSIPVCTQQMLDLYVKVIEQKGNRISESQTRWEQLMRQWSVEMELVQEKIGCLLADNLK